MPKEVKHKVGDKGKWHSEHGKADAERKKHGVTSSKWEPDPNDPEGVIVRHVVSDENKQKAFRDSDNGKKHRKDADVK